jgi:hypothetical protein
MPFFMSTILSKGAPLPPAAAIASHLKHHWPRLAAPERIDEDDQAIRLRFGDVDVELCQFAAPYPSVELEGPCANSSLWPHAGTELRGHNAHTLVTVNAGLAPVAKSAILTQVTVAVMSAMPDAMGVLWSNAMLLVPTSLFIDYAKDVLPHGPPLDLWVDFRLRKLSDNRCAGFTTGLAGLGLMELEVPESPERPWELRYRMHCVAGYLLERGPVINDGDSVGDDLDDCIRVHYGASGMGLPGCVMRLTYGQHGKASWWRRLALR